MPASLSDRPNQETAGRSAAPWLSGIVALLALLAIGTSVLQLERLRDGVAVSTAHVGTIPLTIWRPAAAAANAPVLVIAHGFAGSQQLMQPLALTLARNGYVAVTFDFPGHGLNPEPLRGGLADAHAMQHDLVDSLAAVAAFARPLGDGRLGVAGHSMAADVVVRFAADRPQVQATVAVSLFLPEPTPVYANNLLIIDGALEPAMLKDQAFAIVRETTGDALRAGVTYGNFADGSARRIAYAGGVEHIGVLYSADTLHEALGWFDAAFDSSGAGSIDNRGHWLALLLLGAVAAAWPLARLLPRIPLPARSPAVPALLTAVVALVPAIATPLILWKMPTDFLPILLGDYLALHFGLYGLLTLLCLRLAPPAAPTRIESAARKRLVLATAGAILFNLIAIGLPLDRYVFSFFPGVWRYSLIAVILIGTMPYFMADEWLTRHCTTLRGAYALTKVCFLASLVFAIALNPEKLFFLVIIVPAILLLFVVYGLFSRWAFRRTGNAFVAAASNAVLFAWFVAVTFPLVVR